MDGIVSPIAKIDIDEYTESFNNYCMNYDICDELNGNIPDDCAFSETSLKYSSHSLQSSLENLVNNFDSVISECFNSEEKIDTLSPISEKYKSCNTLVDKNQLWLSLTGSVTMALNLDWRSFKSYEEFKKAVNVSNFNVNRNCEEDFINQNLDLPDDENLAKAMDHHSLVTSSIPSDYEPLKTADEVIQEIDKIMGISNDEYNSGDMTSNLDCSDFVGSEEAINLRRSSVLYRSDGWINDLEKMSMLELNNVLDELEDSIRDFSSLLVEELAQRENLEYEKEQRDLFVKLLHEIEQRQEHKKIEVQSKKPSVISLDESFFEDETPKRSSSWRSIFSIGRNGSRSHRDNSVNRISRSSDNLNSIGVSIPIHSHMEIERDLLEVFNNLLQAMISNSSQFNQLLTDYILNVYAPAEDVSLNMSLDML